MSLGVLVYNSDFSGRLRESVSTLRVNSFTHNAIGGPDQASISVRGSPAGIWDAVGMLRCPVEIYSSDGVPLWWGFVSRVKVRHLGSETTISLGSMFNRIMAKYSYTPSGAAQADAAETTWLSDAESVGLYGTKERRFSFSNMAEDAALRRLNRILSETKYPYPVYSSSEAEESLSAHLECRGWWHTLLWKYYTQLAGEESYTATGVGVQHIGTSASQRVSQGFQRQSSDAWRADAIYVRARKAGSPVDQLRVILADASRSTLASGLISPDNLTTSYQWLRCALSSAINLAAATDYHVILERTGSLSGTDYYATDVVEPPSYAPGVFRFWNGSTWATRSPDADMPFRVTGVRETSDQLRDVVEDAGQFFTGVEVGNASGVFTNPYRNGDQTAHSYARDLIETATINDRRLLATVTRARVVRIYEEPSTDEILYFVDAHRRVSTRTNEPIPAIYTPHAVWARMYQIIPDTIHSARLADASKMFIEQTEYEALTNTAHLTLRGARTIQDIGSIEEG